MFFAEKANGRQGTYTDPRAAMVNSWSCLKLSTRLAVTELESIASDLIKKTFADSTLRCYSAGQSTYLSFCIRFSLQHLPASEQQLILVTADPSQRLSYRSIRVYISAVRFLHIANGQANHLKEKLQLNLLLRGIHAEEKAWQEGSAPSHHPTYTGKNILYSEQKSE